MRCFRCSGPARWLDSRGREGRGKATRKGRFEVTCCFRQHRVNGLFVVYINRLDRKAFSSRTSISECSSTNCSATSCCWPPSGNTAAFTRFETERARIQCVRVTLARFSFDESFSKLCRTQRKTSTTFHLAVQRN